MKQHEREYFISRIRSGFYKIAYQNIDIKILTPTIDQEFDFNDVYSNSYNSCLEQGIKTEDEMHGWLIERGLWTKEEDEKIEGIKKDIEKLKLAIYQSATDEQKRETTRLYLRHAEKVLKELLTKKNIYFNNTCEGIASVDRIYAFISSCSYIGNERCDFTKFPLELISNLYHSKILNDSQIRELARSEPWRSLWMLNDSKTFNLFLNKDRELSIDQKNLLVWSRMYDNIQESMDCPSEDVINDDDMLDGWFISQKKKREKERAESDIENNMNSKISNSDEVFVFTKTKKDFDKVESLNSEHAKVVKKQRFHKIISQGEVSQEDFYDERLKIRSQANQNFKDKFRR